LAGKSPADQVELLYLSLKRILLVGVEPDKFEPEMSPADPRLQFVSPVGDGLKICDMLFKIVGRHGSVPITRLRSPLGISTD
jgi:hypothetical protein